MSKKSPDQKIRALTLGWDFDPAVSGGVGPACRGLSRALRALGVDMIYLTPCYESMDPEATELRLKRLSNPRPEDIPHILTDEKKIELQLKKEREEEDARQRLKGYHGRLRDLKQKREQAEVNADIQAPSQADAAGADHEIDLMGKADERYVLETALDLCSDEPHQTDVAPGQDTKSLPEIDQVIVGQSPDPDDLIHEENSKPKPDSARGLEGKAMDAALDFCTDEPHDALVTLENDSIIADDIRIHGDEITASIPMLEVEPAKDLPPQVSQWHSHDATAANHSKAEHELLEIASDAPTSGDETEVNIKPEPECLPEQEPNLEPNLESSQELRGESRGDLAEEHALENDSFTESNGDSQFDEESIPASHSQTLPQPEASLSVSFQAMDATDDVSELEPEPEYYITPEAVTAGPTPVQESGYGHIEVRVVRAEVVSPYAMPDELQTVFLPIVSHDSHDAAAAPGEPSQSRHHHHHHHHECHHQPTPDDQHLDQTYTPHGQHQDDGPHESGHGLHEHFHHHDDVGSSIEHPQDGFHEPEADTQGHASQVTAEHTDMTGSEQVVINPDDSEIKPPPAPPKSPHDFSHATLHTQLMDYANQCVQLVKNDRFDVVHAHDWVTFPAATAISGLRRKPLVLHVHSTEFDRRPADPHPMVLTVERRAFQAADRVIAVSGTTRRRLIEAYQLDPGKVVVAPNARDDDPLPTPSELKLKANEPLVLFMGRLTAAKGPATFLAAAKKALKVIPDLRFVVAGDGELLPWLIDQCVEMGIQRRVTFTGFLNEEDKSRMLSSASVYVMPSWEEPYGLTVMEAIRSGTPVIVSKNAGVAEYLRSVIKIDAWDTNQIAEKIVGVCRNDEMRQAIVETAMREWRDTNWRQAAEICVNTYKDLVSSR